MNLSFAFNSHCTLTTAATKLPMKSYLRIMSHMNAKTTISATKKIECTTTS